MMKTSVTDSLIKKIMKLGKSKQEWVRILLCQVCCHKNAKKRIKKVEMRNLYWKCVVF